ncbi:hybrid sensor histidine kinase/response regulator [Burkholderia sp. JP2-270]|uniref:sensor histidine kinase n=1 Tax=Burkholderia sp. JP2-270 TaxID=2217913 RepID=UPI000DA41FCC|nr:response regulator [Burkholderia sp. JP2-270]AWV05076.1 hybrid sensor histidine kinase/response regulator [Burkholderia sp. JP2-270]
MTRTRQSVDVLIAEDSATQAEQLRLLLEEAGHRVRVAVHGRMALEAARAHKPDVLITDIVMPDMDGYELCKTVKADDTLADVPVILITALNSIVDIAHGLACGADNFIRKPYDPNALIERIDYLLSNRELRKESKTQSGLEIYLAGERHFITSGREQMLDLLVSTYDEAIKTNEALKQREQEVWHLNKDLEQRAAALEAANRELESFSYSVSHDLRTPLRVIDGYSSILQEEYANRLGDDGQRLLGTVRESAQRMSQLIEHLLEFSRCTRQSISRTRCDMTAMARHVFDELWRDPGSAPGGRGSTMPPEFLLDALPDAFADPALIRQVWVNLISNAIKYSCRREHPVIRISGSMSGGECVYSIEDNGAGFEMRLADKLFTVFQRLHRVDEFPGTGVGLAISQRIVKRHGGRIWARAEVDKGATFEFALPASDAKHEHTFAGPQR